MAMLHTITMTHNNLVMTSAYDGEVNYDEFLKAYNERVSHPLFSQINILIVDYSDVTSINFDVAHIKAGAKLAEQASEINPNITLIALMKTQEQYGMTRMWQVYIDAIPWRSHIVKTTEERDELVTELLAEID